MSPRAPANRRRFCHRSAYHHAGYGFPEGQRIMASNQGDGLISEAGQARRFHAGCSISGSMRALRPRQASYQFVVITGKTIAQTIARAKRPRIQVLAKESWTQVVWNGYMRIAMIAFRNVLRDEDPLPVVKEKVMGSSESPPAYGTYGLGGGPSWRYGAYQLCCRDHFVWYLVF